MAVSERLNDHVVLWTGDCLDVMAAMDEASVDAVVTDPPYGLEFMGKEWDSFGRNSPPSFTHSMQDSFKGFKPLPRPGGLKIEGIRAFQAFSEEWARAAYRVLKPGGHLVAFAAPKNQHRLICAIEDAGFEVRDCLMWLFGTGFPKSHNVALAIDKINGAPHRAKSFNYKGGGDRSDEFAENGREFLPPYESASAAARQWEGWGTALKPAYEPICLARKPLSEPTVAANVLRWRTGALNIDGTRVETGDRPYSYPNGRGGEGWHGRASLSTNLDVPLNGSPLGRWPANLCHDGSSEVVGFGDSGSAARFFYSAKASKADRIASKHPTVKPVALMRWLARMVCPPGGTILDPFAGSGTTGQAASLEGFNAILIEREPEYQDDIRRRIASMKNEQPAKPPRKPAEPDLFERMNVT